MGQVTQKTRKGGRLEQLLTYSDHTKLIQKNSIGKIPDWVHKLWLTM